MKVVFVQKFVPHYRLPFFTKVKEELKRRGVEFELVYGQPDPYEGSKVKMEYPEWGTRVNSRIVKFSGKYIYWQGAHRYVKRGDIVIAEHAAKLLDNYLMYIKCRMGWIQFGYFGHGENFQTKHELFVSKHLKKAMLTKVSRWFAYTDISKNSLLKQGVDESIITVVNNTLEAPAVTPIIDKSNPHKFLYIGGLYADKRLDILLTAAELVAKQVPTFELHVVGEGPQSDIVEKAADSFPWLKYHRSLYGEERNKILGEAAAILMPGLVGLVAIDSFYFQCPIIYSEVGQHSPEVVYLEHDQNALMDKGQGTTDTYANLILKYINEPGLATKLQAGCASSAKLYTIDNMVTRFCDGIDLCRNLDE